MENIYVVISLTWDYERVMVQLSVPGYVRYLIHSFQQENPKREQDSPYPCNPSQDGNNNRIIIDKHPHEALDTSNQKLLQKIVVKFLYHERAIESTMSMSLNSLVAVQTKTTMEKKKRSPIP